MQKSSKCARLYLLSHLAVHKQENQFFLGFFGGNKWVWFGLLVQQVCKVDVSSSLLPVSIPDETSRVFFPMIYPTGFFM